MEEYKLHGWNVKVHDLSDHLNIETIVKLLEKKYEKDVFIKKIDYHYSCHTESDRRKCYKNIKDLISIDLYYLPGPKFIMKMSAPSKGGHLCTINCGKFNIN